jgi:hypothetical protein
MTASKQNQYDLALTPLYVLQIEVPS